MSKRMSRHGQNLELVIKRGEGDRFTAFEGMAQGCDRLFRRAVDRRRMLYQQVGDTVLVVAVMMGHENGD